MNVFDIIVYLALAWAVFNGWRRGFLLQMMSLVAVIAALYFAAQYGSELERILAINVGVEGVVGFIIIFVGALIITAIGGYVLRAVFRFAGLGVADILLGILFSVAKLGLIVSVLFSWFASVNKNYDWVSKQTVEESRWFKPISEVTDKLTPYFNELTENFLD
ncbi:MAG: CvpA family protein [Alistipes sp.]|jgi:membrane protein required for colicin V production|nr:CvpA family protein [Alistipes sp.]MBQ5898536.1 CvpA family protein [Alistipes sp.]